MRGFITIFVMFVTSVGGYAQLTGRINGTLAGDSTYTVIGSIQVLPGDSLVIEAGAVLLFDAGTEFIIRGNLQVCGTEDDSVYFQASGAQDWNGITFNNAEDSCRMQYAVIKQATCPTQGGGVYAQQSSLIFEHCSIVDNFAQETGGGMHLWECYLRLEDCLFADNVVLGIFGEGGGIKANGCVLDISDCHFTRNHAPYGGSLCPMPGCEVYVENCIFDFNVCDYAGGIFCEDGVSITIDSCTFANNTNIYRGGALYITNTPNSISNSFFRNNQTNDSGGAIFITANSIHMNNCDFIDNISGMTGGAVYADCFEPSNVTDCFFGGNTAAGVGGIIVGYAEVTNCIFENNSPEGIYSSSGVVMTDCDVHSNLGFGAKGAFDLIQDCLIYENGSDILGGGGVYMGGSTGTISHCLIGHNYGYGVYVHNAAVTLDSCIIDENDSSGVYSAYTSILNVDSCVISNNYGSKGAGVYADWSFVTIRNSDISANFAYLSGGGVYLEHCLISVVENSRINDNCAGGAAGSGYGGGGAYLYASEVNFNHIVMDNNISEFIGGGLSARGNSEAYIDRCTFNANEAGGGGGGIYSDSSILNMDNSILSGSANGSGIYFGEQSYPYIRYCDFYANNPTNFVNAPANMGWMFYVNPNGDSTDFFHNIYLDPEFADTAYYLTAGSPCIDAGDPESVFDPDSTVADMGAYYYDQSSGVEEQCKMQNYELKIEGYPNPFNQQIVISFELRDAGEIELKVYDIGGREVQRLEAGSWRLGKNSVVWDAWGCGSGVYFVRLVTGEGRGSVKKVVLMK